MWFEGTVVEYLQNYVWSPSRNSVHLSALTFLAQGVGSIVTHVLYKVSKEVLLLLLVCYMFESFAKYCA